MNERMHVIFGGTVDRAWMGTSGFVCAIAGTSGGCQRLKLTHSLCKVYVEKTWAKHFPFMFGAAVPSTSIATLTADARPHATSTKLRLPFPQTHDNRCILPSLSIPPMTERIPMIKTGARPQVNPIVELKPVSATYSPLLTASLPLNDVTVWFRYCTTQGSVDIFLLGVRRSEWRSVVRQSSDLNSFRRCHSASWTRESMFPVPKTE